MARLPDSQIEDEVQSLARFGAEFDQPVRRWQVGLEGSSQRRGGDDPDPT